MYVACGKKGDNNNIISKVWPLSQATLTPVVLSLYWQKVSVTNNNSWRWKWPKFSNDVHMHKMKFQARRCW